MEPVILYEDNELIVCRKSAGVPVQSDNARQQDMVSILNNYLGRDGIFVVHRLDQPVEGVMVFAKTKSAAANLTRQITEGRTKKIYQAVCCVVEGGNRKLPEKNADHLLVDYLKKDGRTNTSQVVQKGAKDGKRSELVYRILAKSERYFLAEIDLKTGRHHQIRVQMAHAGFPLYGDQKYNSGWERYLTEEDKEKRRIFPALCAVSLSFVHPSTGKRMEFHTEPSIKMI